MQKLVRADLTDRENYILDIELKRASKKAQNAKNASKNAKKKKAK